MTTAAKCRLKSWSSQCCPPPPTPSMQRRPRIQKQWNVIAGETPKYSWHIKSNSARSKNPYVNSHTLETLQMLSVSNTHRHTLQFDQSQSETLLTICSKNRIFWHLLHDTSVNQASRLHQTASRGSAKPRDAGQTPEGVPVIQPLKTRLLRGQHRPSCEAF